MTGAPAPALATDPAVQAETLDNGLRLIVRENSEPRRRAELRLVVAMGSIGETEAQRGVAHIVEHLGFQATRSFESHQIVSFLEAIGARFGACQNAYTSLEETCFTLHVPVDKPHLLDRALDVLSEFAFGIRAADEDVEHERGPVMEEWRASRTGPGRVADTIFRATVARSLYADRLPIGLESVISGVPGAEVRRFYADWYHPGRMALVGVGDFADVGGAEGVLARMRARFGEAPARPLRAWTPPEVPRTGAVDVCCASDAEITVTTVSVECRLPARHTRTEADVRRDTVRWLLTQVLDARLSKLALNPPAPFFNASVNESQPVRCLDVLGVAARANEGEALVALRGLLDEVERAKRHGFSERELSVAKARLRAQWRTSFVERDHTDSAVHCDDLVAAFLDGSVCASVEVLYELAQRHIPSVTADELRAMLAESLDWSRDCLVAVSEPDALTSEAAVRAVLADAAAAAGRDELAPWHLDSTVCLFPELPAPGRVAHERRLAMGVSARDASAGQALADDLLEMVLENGMRVTLQRTDFLEDDVTYQAFALGGQAQRPAGDTLEARHACWLADEMGCFGMQPHEFADYLADTNLSIRCDVGMHWARVAGAGSPRDLTKLFELIHTLFTTSPELRPEIVAQLMAMVRQDVANRLANPRQIFNDAVQRVNSGGHWYYRPVTLEDVDAVDPAGALAFFREHFCNPARFTLVLVGNIDADELRALARQYLATIPRCDAAAPVLAPGDLRSVGIRFPAGCRREDLLVPMREANSAAQMTVAFSVPAFDEGAPWALPDFLMRLGLVAELLQTKLLQHLRFVMGRVYSVSVHASGSKRPGFRGEGLGALYVSFDCSPDEVDALLEASAAELARVAREGPSDADLASLKEVALREHEEMVRTNEFWADMVESGYASLLFQGDVTAVARGWRERYAHVLRSVTRAELAAACGVVLAQLGKRQTIVTMRPVETNVARWRILGLAAAGMLVGRVWAAVGRRVG